MGRIAFAIPTILLCSAVFGQQPTPPVENKLRGNELMNPSTDDYTSTKLFGLEVRGSKFVYVFDRSGSMGENKNLPLRRAKEELLASLNDLNERQQFYIVFYNEEPKLFDPGPAPHRLIFANDANKETARRFINNITADGGTDHMQALNIALRLHPDVIFLLTDGEAKDDPTPEDLKRIDHLNSGEASINVIQFAAKSRPDSSLIELAKQNRGQHVVVDIMNYQRTSTPEQ
jgi:hypothetical protein